MADDDVLTTPSGTEIELRRLPDRRGAPLRAWDAADELLLAYLAEHSVEGERWLVVNDLFGALTVALHDQRPHSWGDSVTSHEATTANLRRNGLDSEDATLIPSTEVPAGPFDVVVIKVPRSLALLEDQLRLLRPLISANAVVVGGGMVKAIHRSTLDLFESILGPSPTSLAKKKARLIHPTVDTSIDIAPSPFPTTYRLDAGATLVEHANVFSRGKLDIGTRAFLDHLPGIEPGADVLDLGCGNGLLGLTMAAGADLASATFVDESYHALESARANYAGWELSAPATFLAERTLASVPSGTIDVVVCNPPFHTHQSRNDDTAKQMFADAHRVLREGGRLAVVGNRHLDYRNQLKRRFGNCQTTGSTPKFVVLEAIR